MMGTMNTYAGPYQQQNGQYFDPPPILGPDGQPLPRFILPHVQAFSSIFNPPSKSYLASFDEALKNSRQTARDMMRDASIQRWVQARLRPVAKSKWEIIPEDVKDSAQVEAAKFLHSVVAATPCFSKLRYSLNKKVWYGRYGVQVIHGQRMVGGKECTAVVQWAPINGDKITFKWNGVPGIRIHAGVADDLRRKGGSVELTDQGMTLFLDRRDLRERFVIGKHEIEDADFEEPDLAGGIGGVGLRHYLYWTQWLKMEVFSWLLGYLENMGAGGLTVVTYDAANKNAKAEAQSQFAQPTNIVFLPAPIGGEKAGQTVQRIEPSGTGNQILMGIVNDYFGAIQKEMILGQELSSSAKATGLGSKVASLHADTLQDILDFDADSLDEDLTEDFLMPLVRANLPGSRWQFKFKTTLRQPDAAAKLEAGKMLYEMGVELKLEELREAGGYSKPEDTDETLSKGEQQEELARALPTNEPPEPEPTEPTE